MQIIYKKQLFVSFFLPTVFSLFFASYTCLILPAVPFPRVKIVTCLLKDKQLEKTYIKQIKIKDI